ncbi:MOSC domain-containing protein [Paenibacillus sacheonensis]|uniref:MOSC domain-containing protein n=1 Tax=Paenibacillus sacheonensis TaxID=742054 RepID=A0A7X5BX15_9BACL|nr:MOSC domain-containing protein [Paenibacillus sacheonensis]MBM7563326.1 MOSC domain-containing protein YiiM [Paenibacillus sacheonensis]NBC68117.1 MOSC domain-containing protein [Paenibacillus sacheonensis]
MELGKLVSLNVSLVELIPFGKKEVATGINKKPFAGALRLGRLGLPGDAQGDTVHHGGADKAVCVYTEVHFPYWTEKWGRPAIAASFGENFTVSALTEQSVCIGDVVSVGHALLQVSQPRQPCFKLGMKHGLPSLQQDVEETGFTGFYFRVLEEGLVAQGDTLILRKRHEAGITVAEANRVMHQDKRGRDGIAKLLTVDALSESWQHTLRRRLAALDSEA